MSTFLKSLSPEERDKFISRIPFVKDPKYFGAYSENVLINDVPVVNYSQLYEGITDDLKEKFSFPAPESMCTGDILMLGGYRGVGSYYVMWLAKDLIQHDAAFFNEYERLVTTYCSPVTKTDQTANENEEPQKQFNLDDYKLSPSQWKAVAKFFSNEEWYEDFENSFKKIVDCPQLFEDINSAEDEQPIELILKTFGPKRSRESTSPISLVDRNTLIESNKSGTLHCYLFVHPDEMGYYAPSIWSSVGFDYHKRDYSSIVLDPLLTHSQSYYGLILADRDQSVLGDIDNKLGDCDRFYAEGEDYSVEDIQWVDIADGNGLVGSVYRPDVNFFDTIRDVLSRHFEWLNNNDNR